MSESKRLDFVDIAKGIGIILVVMGHLLPENSYLRNIIYSFHMPLFFFLSGFFLGQLEHDNSCVSLKESIKKQKKLLQKYIVYSVAFILFDYLIRINLLHEIEKNQLIWDVYKTITLYGINVLWFIPALCMAKILSQIVIIKLGVKKGTVFSVVVFMIIALMGKYLSMEVMSENIVKLAIYFPLITVLRSFGMMCFVILGYLFRIMACQLLQDCRQYKLYFCGLICFALVLFCTLKNDVVDIHFLYMGKPILTFISSLSGCLLVVILSIMIEKTRIGKQVLIFFGRNSLFIMVIHQYFFISRACEWFTQTMKIYSVYLNIILTCISSGVIAYIVSCLKRKLKYAKRGNI